MFIKKDKPTQNASIERIYRTYRTEIVDLYLFTRQPDFRLGVCRDNFVYGAPW
ncbi:TPA: transposase [Enterobacter cloacae]|nr:transposase [Enterobacter cloacae]